MVQLMVSTELYVLEMHCSVTLERINELIKDNPGFDKYFLEMDDDGSCGCYHNCECSHARTVLIGQRKETKTQMKQRQNKARRENAAHIRAAKARELNHLKRLKEKYPDS